MNDVGGQIARPVRAQMSKLVIDDRLESGEHGIEISRALRHRAPMTVAHAVFARAGIGFERAVHRAERRAAGFALGRRRLGPRNALKKMDEAGGTSRNLLDGDALATADHRRTRAIPAREIVEQVYKNR